MHNILNYWYVPYFLIEVFLFFGFAFLATVYVRFLKDDNAKLSSEDRYMEELRKELL